MTVPVALDLHAVKHGLLAAARALGFDALGVATLEIPEDERHLIAWLADGFHGEMHYMQRHGLKRARPAELVPGTLRVVSVRMDYWPAAARPAAEVLADGRLGYVSRLSLIHISEPTRP